MKKVGEETCSKTQKSRNIQCEELQVWRRWTWLCVLLTIIGRGIGGVQKMTLTVCSAYNYWARSWRCAEDELDCMFCLKLQGEELGVCRRWTWLYVLLTITGRGVGGVQKMNLIICSAYNYRARSWRCAEDELDCVFCLQLQGEELEVCRRWTWLNVLLTIIGRGVGGVQKTNLIICSAYNYRARNWRYAENKLDYIFCLQLQGEELEVCRRRTWLCVLFTITY
jgi:hypothetical protein